MRTTRNAAGRSTGLARRGLALVALAWLAAATLACGGKAGGACSQTGFVCEGKGAALECIDGVWVSLPCRGALGCRREGDVVRCDMSANQEGDGCASSANGRGMCTQDGSAVLECREGTLLKTRTCSSCAVSGELVVCSP